MVRYEAMHFEVERCARIDEAADILDKAAALLAYARQWDDRDLDVWTIEIELRALIRIGELVGEPDTHQGARTDRSKSGDPLHTGRGGCGLPRRATSVVRLGPAFGPAN